MEANILCTLLAQRIDPTQFHLEGLTVVLNVPDQNNKPVDAPHESPYDTPENQAIVTDVIKNYDTLSVGIAEQIADVANVEALIEAKMREQAITALQAEGKLTKEGNIIKGGLVNGSK